ncbi:diatom-specific cyclin [Seminavis robusta]|uniref:Diatom-specific cyclin n=1 Tax=Seminavis robusta TaxID=568900 RepID=A0A9N8HKN9_9STRA|nr:diatom-specific cyclin [Seminavis robusta]|eukprot:Sro748_g196620.1 diatom-specific cyclin (313) ;mRNA; f:6633-7650
MPALVLTPTPLEDALLTLVDPIEVTDRLKVMRQQESGTYRVFDYLKKHGELLKRVNKPIDEDCRVKMCEWCYQVVDFCKFRRETVSIGMSYLDRYLCSRPGRSALANRKEYQLTAMTALYIAIKIHEPLEMETALLADLSRGCYEEMEFVHKEEELLQALKWRVGGPTALGFIQHYLALLPDTVHPAVAEAMMDYARYQTELAISEHSLVDIHPSEIGLAALLNAMEGMDVSLLSPKAQAKFVRTLEKVSGCQVEDVAVIQSTLSMLLCNLVKNDDQVLDACEETDLEREYQTRSSPSKHRQSPVSVTRKQQ